MAKDKINEEAWKILNIDERTSLGLSLSFNKSTWEAGEIMKKAHFKYLEIQKRARKFLEIFTNHFEKYGGLFPEDINLSFAFKEYLTLTILERKTISKATKYMEDASYSIASRRNKLIMRELEKLARSNEESYRDFYSLILDFDRWNNFRILPLEVQEPSAFKRRNKVRNKKHLRNLTNLPQYSVLKLIEIYGYNGKYPKLYLPLISQYIKDGYKVIQIKHNSINVGEITQIGFFLFESRVKAIEFAKLIANYFMGDRRNCREGQKFWPNFRVMISEAINFREIENIHKSRSYLDKAIFDLDRKLSRSKRENKSTGEQRVEDSKLFYQ
jgi:hypothetical protein